LHTLRRPHHRHTFPHPVDVTDSLQLEGRLLVLFDGHCGLCNRAVRWFLRRDRHDRLRFAPASSPFVASLLASLTPSDSLTDLARKTIIVVSDPILGNPDLRDSGQPAEQVRTPRLFVRSAAILVLLAELPEPWPFIAGIFRVVPRPLCDLVYHFIGRIRYRIWGRYDACPLPAPDEREHFL
jgi:predicted DCC family thiol-disulfide oxidoreductase YuxK